MAQYSRVRRTSLRRLIHLLQAEQRRRAALRDFYDWNAHARETQKIPPGDWRLWLILAGRGFGKTRTGAETIRSWATSGQHRRIALIANTITEAREIMVEGESGLLRVSPHWEKLSFEAHRRRLVWPNGAIATLYGAENAEHLRGPQFDAAWVDEFAKFSDPEEVLNQLFLSLRLGQLPRAIFTTTPRPLPILHRLLKRTDIAVTRGSTFDNKGNLPETFFSLVKERFGGTLLGAQELYGEIIEAENRLWTPDLLEQQRVQTAPPLTHILISVDPALSHKSSSDETGIIVIGQSVSGIAYVLADLSVRAAPEKWMRQVCEAYKKFQATHIILEANVGGELFPALFFKIDPTVHVKTVRASFSKWARAEPVSLLYQQRKVFHVGHFEILEQQMTEYTQDTTKSPDRMDALVWGLQILYSSPPQASPSVWHL